MEIRNIRRLFLVNKGLRIWRKKAGAGCAVFIRGNDLKYLYCLWYYGGYYTAKTVQDYMKGQGNDYQLRPVYTALDKLVKAGFVVKNNTGRYGLTIAGRAALNEIEKCIRSARPDR